MKKQIFLFAVAALALASCSSDKIAEEKQVAQQQAEPGAVLFEAYTQRGVTRAGTVGTLTTDGMKTGAFKDDGFGVFGYYTDNNTYDKLYLPNFMYNEQVKWDGSSAWTYEPVKYWPNEYGNTAISDDQDKVSFFAYAPWVDVVPTTGKLSGNAELQKWGITGMTRNTATGDPLIKYLVSFDPAHSVDLCWGVCDEDVWTKVVDGGNQTFTKGKPWIDVQRPANAVDQKLKFTFKHATSQLNVQVDAFVDGTDNTNPIAAGSKVYIRSITFEGFATQGTLNLNNTDVNPNVAYWLDYAGTNDLVTGETVTIYDGRKDGKEGTIGGEATNEKVLGLNPQLIQSALWSENATTGVTNTTVNLFRKWNDTEKKYEAASLLEPIYVIPTGDKVKVTIVYDIETEDGQLATYLSDAETNGSSIPNTISKNINFGGSDVLQNGLSYTIKLHLGLNSVKFDAAVSDWKEAGGWSQTDLPANVPIYAASSTSTPETTVTLAADQTTYQFAVSGLTPNAAVDQTLDNVADKTVVTGFSVLNNTANSSGVALATATLAKNTTVNETNTGWAKVIEGSNTYQVNFVQKAAPLGMKVTAVDGSAKTISLSSTASGDPWSDVNSASKIKVMKNGVALTYSSASSLAATEFKFDAGTITLGQAPVAGDVYSITVQAGKAPEETYTITMGSITFAAKSGYMGVEKGKTKYIDVVNTGDGKLQYQPGTTWTTGCAIDVETGLFTAGSASGDNVVKVTAANSDHCFYLTPSIWGHVGVADYVVGNNYTKAYSDINSHSGQGAGICGFKAGEIVTASAKDNWITLSASSYTCTDGTSTVNWSVGANGTGSARSTTITLTGSESGTIVITITQPGT